MTECDEQFERGVERLGGVGDGPMIQEHVREIHRAIDERPLSIRVAITIVAVAALPVLGTGVRRLGAALDLGAFTLPLLAIAHVPVVVALVCVWSIGCDLCR